MEHRSIGSLSVSVVGLGCNQLGTAACDEQSSIALVQEALDHGVTLFDTSDEYGRDYSSFTDLTGWGRSEELLGRALGHRRSEVIVASKFGPVGAVVDGKDALGNSDDIYTASAAGIRLAVDESLRRLGTDYIDLYQLHFPDPRYPIEETLGALDELVQSGKVREIGCSNFDGAMLGDAAQAAEATNVGRFASVQNQLNMLNRRAARDTLPTCEELGTAFLPYYPLASGVLTGKYRRGEATPTGTRLSDQVTDDVRSRMLSDRTFDRIEALDRFAASSGRSLLELAFAWLLAHPPVASVIAGASKPGQVAGNSAAATWRLTDAELDTVDQLLAAN